MRKILFLTNIPSPYRVHFFTELGRFCDLTVCFEGRKATDRDKRWVAEKTDNFNQVFLSGIRTGKDKFLCPGIKKHLSKKWDHIVICGYSSPTEMMAIEYLRLKKIPFILEVDGGIIRNDKSLVFKMKKHFLSSAKWWFSTGEATTDYLVHYGADKERCFKYPFTSICDMEIETAQKLLAQKEQIKKDHQIPNKLIVLSVGRFIQCKGFDVLLNAIPSVTKEAEFYIIGGEPTEEYKDIVERHHLSNVTFLPFMKKDELDKYFASADLFVLPTRGDVWGLVINEAMAFKLPIITTDKCVAGVELSNHNGYIVKVDSVEELSDAISGILNDDKKRVEMGQNSLAKIKNYTIEKMAQRHLEVFEFTKIVGE